MTEDKYPTYDHLPRAASGYMDQLLWTANKAAFNEAYMECVNKFGEDLVESYLKIKSVKEPDTIVKVQAIEKAISFFTDKRDLARRFLEIQPIYYDENKIWWIWNQNLCCWGMVDETDILNSISNASEANTIRSNERNEILEALRQEARKMRPESPETSLLQFKTEIIDINTGKRKKSSPNKMFVNPLPYSISGNPETPTFDKLFREWVGEEESITLYEILAYCMLPDYPIERIICLHGSGSNGKSCFLKILRKFIGVGNVCSTDLETLLKSRFEKAKLYKKLVCEMGETNLSQIENTQLIKRIVSGKDMIGMEMKNKTPFETVNYAKLIIATNNIPPTDDKTEGFYRRWLIVDFPNRFEKEIDVLANIPEEEYNNLTTRCILVLKNLLERRAFTHDGNIEQRKERYESKSNPFDKFWKENVNPDAFDKDIPVWEFNQRYNEWLKDRKLREASEVSINKLMKVKNISQQRIRKEWFENNEGSVKQWRCWVGIAWK